MVCVYYYIKLFTILERCNGKHFLSQFSPSFPNYTEQVKKTIRNKFRLAQNWTIIVIECHTLIHNFYFTITLY